MQGVQYYRGNMGVQGGHKLQEKGTLKRSAKDFHVATHEKKKSYKVNFLATSFCYFYFNLFLSIL